MKITYPEIGKAIKSVSDVLTPDLLAPAYARISDGHHAKTGHCAVASEAVYFLLGGPKAGLRAMVARDDDGTTHWWLEHINSGLIIDPTREQYDDAGSSPPYERGIPGRACGFQGMRRNPKSLYGFGLNPGKRAAEVLRRIETGLGNPSRA